MRRLQVVNGVYIRIESSNTRLYAKYSIRAPALGATVKARGFL